ncbi:MAG: hypothetical protein LAO03_11475 [Acidobacteriia bacterium]|nr:hypothetical protein [Terriglobia bacterium]
MSVVPKLFRVILEVSDLIGRARSTPSFSASKAAKSAAAAATSIVAR